MNALNINSIFIVTIFILSIRSLNSPTNQPGAEIIQQRNTCMDKINSVFKDEDLYNHAIIAINQFQLIEIEDHPDLNSCVYSIPGEDEVEDRSDIFAYYLSFKEYLLYDDIPFIQDLCHDLSILLANPGTAIANCIRQLSDMYTNSTDTALYKAFYTYRIGNIPSALLNMIDTDLLSDEGREYSLDAYEHGFIQNMGDEQYLDVSMAYFTEIKWKFDLKIDTSENGEPNGFLNPHDFCKRKYNVQVSN